MRTPKKIFMRIFLIALCMLFLFSSHSYASQSNEDKLVKEFYVWYIKKCINGENPIHGDDIYKYVSPCTINNIRIGYLKCFWDADYFTKSQDIWDSWLTGLVVHPATKINDNVSIVPVSFRWNGELYHHLIVFVQNDNGVSRITKVTGTDYFNE